MRTWNSPGRDMDAGLKLGVLSLVCAFAAVPTIVACAMTTNRPAAPVVEVLAIVGGSILDPASNSQPMVGTVLMSGGRITHVGSGVAPPQGARVVDASGRFLVSGLWDMHTHFTAPDPPGSEPEHYVGYGVLGTRDMGGYLDAQIALRRDIMEGRRVGPTILLPGPTLNGEQPADYHRVIANAQDARETVRSLHQLGVDFIKIHRATTREVFRAVAEETRRVGVYFGGHVPLQMKWDEAADAGMRTMEHIQTIVENEVVPGPDEVKSAFEALQRIEGARGDQIFAALARNHCYFTPTMVSYEESWEKNPPELRALKQRYYKRLKPIVGRASKAGVKILAGTDRLHGNRGEALLDELDRLGEAGLTPREILGAATTNAFDLNQRGPGPIVPGGEASLLVVDGNPLVDIRSLRRLSGVVLRGQLLGPEELARLRNLGR
jgi:imidazolonepropionase-like amidohydrolase